MLYNFYLIHFSTRPIIKIFLGGHLDSLNSCTSRVHVYAWTSPRMHLISHAPHTCTAPHEPHLVHISCISMRAPHPVCTSTRAYLRVHLTSCTSTRASRAYLRVHLYTAPHPMCTSTCAPHLTCTSSRVHLSCIICTRAPMNLVHPSSPSAIKMDLDHSVSHCYILAISPLFLIHKFILAISTFS